MKLFPAILTAGGVVCLISSVGVLSIAFSNQELQRDIQKQQDDLRVQEGNLEKQKQALQNLDARMEELEKARQAQHEKMDQQQVALQSQHEEIQKQQQELQKQQEQITIGNRISQQIGPNLLRDMATSSLKNEKMKALLARHGYNVSSPSGGAPAAGEKPVP